MTLVYNYTITNMLKRTIRNNVKLFFSFSTKKKKTNSSNRTFSRTNEKKRKERKKRWKNSATCKMNRQFPRFKGSTRKKMLTRNSCVTRPTPLSADSLIVARWHSSGLTGNASPWPLFPFSSNRDKKKEEKKERNKKKKGKER